MIRQGAENGSDSVVLDGAEGEPGNSTLPAHCLSSWQVPGNMCYYDVTSFLSNDYADRPADQHVTCDGRPVIRVNWAPIACQSILFPEF
jgi:hypothetical protein